MEKDKVRLTERIPDTTTETDTYTYNIYEDEDETTITKGIKGGTGGYRGKTTIGNKDE